MNVENTAAVKQAQKEQAYGFYRPSSDDKLDLGFWVKGYKFHWMYSRKQEYSQDRPWVPLTKGKLPASFEKQLLEKRPGYFAEDGMHRHAELVLGFCRDEDLLIHTKERKERNAEQMSQIGITPEKARGMKVKAEFEDDVDLGADAFKNL